MPTAACKQAHDMQSTAPEQSLLLRLAIVQQLRPRRTVMRADDMANTTMGKTYLFKALQQHIHPLLNHLIIFFQAARDASVDELLDSHCGFAPLGQEHLAKGAFTNLLLDLQVLP